MKLKLPGYRKSENITTKPVDVEPYNIPRAQASYSPTLEMMNFTNTVIHTRDHNGLVLTHQPINVRSPVPDFQNKFVIVMRRYINQSTTATTFEDDQINNLRGVEWLEALLQNMRQPGGLHKSHHNIQCTLINLNELTRGKKYLYCREYDVLIMGDIHDGSVVHPNSPRAIKVLMDEIYTTTHTYSISIKHSNGANKLFYVNIGGEVYNITSSGDLEQDEEVRIVFKKPNEEAKVIYSGEIDFNKLKEVGVFTNYEEAYNYSDRHKLGW